MIKNTGGYQSESGKITFTNMSFFDTVLAKNRKLLERQLWFISIIHCHRFQKSQRTIFYSKTIITSSPTHSLFHFHDVLNSMTKILRIGKWHGLKLLFNSQWYAVTIVHIIILDYIMEQFVLRFSSDLWMYFPRHWSCVR